MQPKKGPYFWESKEGRTGSLPGRRVEPAGQYGFQMEPITMFQLILRTQKGSWSIRKMIEGGTYGGNMSRRAHSHASSLQGSYAGIGKHLQHYIMK